MISTGVGDQSPYQPDTSHLAPGPGAGGGSESDHDRSSDRSDDLSSRESSGDQVKISPIKEP